jgi:two-component system, cell cycle response regulator DivK
MVPLGRGLHNDGPWGGRLAIILLVEDSPDNMKLFTTLLSLHGHQVVGLPGGNGLLETMDATRPELVLMDIQLPGRDGFALLEEIRRVRGKAMRVIALTAHAMAGDRERAIGAGFDGYIAKPIDIRKFPAQVKAALAGKMILD